MFSDGRWNLKVESLAYLEGILLKGALNVKLCHVAVMYGVKILSIFYTLDYFHYQSFGNINTMCDIWWVQLFNIYFKTLVMERENGEDPNLYVRQYQFMQRSCVIIMYLIFYYVWNSYVLVSYAFNRQDS